jgi:hypothetical protein
MHYINYNYYYFLEYRLVRKIVEIIEIHFKKNNQEKVHIALYCIYNVYYIFLK